MNNFEEKRKDFQAGLSSITKNTDSLMQSMNQEYNFDPNIAAEEIKSEQLLKFAKAVIGTPYEKFLVYKDPKVQELIEYIMVAIIDEYEKMYGDSFPIEIHTRYKSDESLANKQERYSQREEKKGVEVTDYLGFRILPQKEIQILDADGDSILQVMIDKREEIANYITNEYRELSKNPNMTCYDYCEKCRVVLTALKDVFPEEATERKEYYNDLIHKIDENLNNYNYMIEDPEETKNFREFSDIISIDIKKYLAELEKHNSTETVLYVLNKRLMYIFENSESLKNLRYKCSLSRR